MTPKDIDNAARQWRDGNPDKRSYIILTQDREKAEAQAGVKTTADDCIIMFLLLFATDQAYLTATEAAIELFKQPHIQQQLKDRYYEDEKGIKPKNIKP